MPSVDPFSRLRSHILLHSNLPRNSDIILDNPSCKETSSAKPNKFVPGSFHARANVNSRGRQLPIPRYSVPLLPEPFFLDQERGILNESSALNQAQFPASIDGNALEWGRSIPLQRRLLPDFPEYRRGRSDRPCFPNPVR